MNRFLILLLVCLFSQSAIAQVLTVRDQVSQLPLELVQVYSRNLAQVLTTNHKGQVDVTPLQDIDSIVVRLVGYKPEVLSYEQMRKRQFRLYLKVDNIALNAVIVSATRW